MITENKKQDKDGVYRFRSGKCTVTLKFAKSEVAPTVEEALEKILMGRLD